jgi:phosphatidylglycerol---prolipoprotein diacylglyceryl transferase
MLAAISYTPLVRIQLGLLALSRHGIMAAFGIVGGAARRSSAPREREIDEATIGALVMRAVVGGIVGARFFYVLNHPSEFASPLEWLRVWEGGLTLLGGIAGAVLAGLPLIRRRGLRLFQVLDAAVPGLALGIAIGRLGDLAIADHLGTPTSFALGYRCPPLADVGQTVGSPCPPGHGRAPRRSVRPGRRAAGVRPARLAGTAAALGGSPPP